MWTSTTFYLRAAVVLSILRIRVGAAALYLEEGVSPASVVGRMTSDATENALTDAGPDSPNLLLYVD